VSSTLSDTGPQPAPGESRSPVTPAPEAPAEPEPAASAPASAGVRQIRRAQSRPHIIAFDLIRLIIMVFVVSVHTLAFAGGSVTMSIGAVTTIFHTSRELFIMLTALVLTYNYGKRDSLKVGKFWWRRFYLVIPAYVVWSAIYYAADGAARGAFPAAFLHDLENAGARYHLYFLLVSMQVYLLFPLIRWVLQKTERYHAWLFGVAVAYQAWLTVGLHYKVGRSGSGPIAQFLNAAGQGYWIDTYVLYVVAGALAGWHFEQLCAFTRRHLRSGWRVAAVAAGGVAAGIGVFLIETLVYNATPNNASAVFQPVVIVEALAFGWALLGLGLLWSDRGAPARKFCAAGSASSFGIYLAHPLVLQVLLLIAGASFFGARDGLVGDLHRLQHSSIEVVILLFIAVPLIYALSWAIASAVRRTPLSLPLTGREYKRPDGQETVAVRLGNALVGSPLGRAASSTATRALTRTRSVPRRIVVIALVLAVVASAGSIAGVQVDSAVTRTVNATTSTMQVGNLTRSYTVFTPAKSTLPASAPIIVMLSGINEPQGQEITRDGLIPYVAAGDAEVVYPLAYRESWNAIGCCSWASYAGVDDTGFIEALAKKIDPGNARPIYLVGYSNGARLAYTIACADPLQFDGIAAVKGDPMPWCNIVVPQKFLQVAATNDTDVAYTAGETGDFRETPDALVQDTDLKTADGCSATSEQASQGNMTLTTWPDCFDGSSVSFAVYTAGVHSWPRLPVSYPPASQVIWAWINNTVTVTAQPKAE
jgi:poly(3-hydroxybutyrate) depolymerase/peptidoglycan/LPS O-acetylase OafA/YrhL